MKDLIVKKRIVGWTSEIIKQLAQEFNCTPQSVRNALNYRRNSAKSKDIRLRSLDFGCSVAPMWAYPEMETTHDEVQGLMIHRFGDHMQMEWEKSTGKVQVYEDKEVVIQGTITSEEELITLQKRVQYMAAAY